MKRVVAAGASAFIVLAPACSKGPATADKRGTWCENVKLTTSAEGDRTRFDNTAERVLAVKRELHVETLGCGAYYVGVSADAIMSAVIKAQPLPEGPGFVSNDDPSHCIVVYLNSDAPHPVANPLFTNGVRVYFVDDQIRAKVAQADAKATWCTAIPFSSDSTSDHTGIDNTEERVKRIMGAVSAAVRGCSGVVSFEAVKGNDAKSWVLRVVVKEKKDLPEAGPLFLDGVRTEFSALPPPPPPPTIP